MARILIATLCFGLASAAPWPFSMWRGSQLETATSNMPLPAFYHTTKELTESVNKLAVICPGLSVETLKDGGIEIQVAKYLKPGETSKFKTMVVAGEHAREMIGTEIALSFVQALCGLAPAADIEESKKETEFLVVLNANPMSRTSVEQGQYCTRANANKVDINRNFDADYANAERNNADTNPGQHAFDQPESRMLKTLMENFRPHAYLDLHSGFRGMFFPNAVANDDQLATKLQRLVAPIDEATCKCPLGTANKEVGYHTSGSALDYSFNVLKVPFSMAMEVYLGEDETSEIASLEKRWSNQKGELLKPLATGSSFMENGFNPFSILPLQFIKTSSEDTEKMQPDGCMKYFNPIQEEKFHTIVKSWTNAVAQLSIKSKEIHPAAALKAIQKGPSFKQIIQEEPAQGEAPVWFAVKVLGLLAIVYVAFKYYKIKQSKSAEAEPLNAQMAPVQISD